MNIMKRTLPILLLSVIFCPVSYSATQDSTTSYDKEQLKQDYKLFLQQLKSLNAQYKEITGEIGQVMKEEGAPSWDMGEDKDLGGGAFLKEAEKDMVLTLDLPGFKKDSIKLSFQDGKKLLITAQRKVESTTRSYERTFDLPVPGDYKGTSAIYEDGVLTVKIPKVVTKEVVIPIK